MALLPVFDLDGTLLDSDEALVAPFLALGIARERIEFGLPLDEECARLGVRVGDYLRAYDVGRAKPYPGVPDVIERLDRWGVCSNKHPASGRAELDRLGWRPEVATFAEPGTGQKRLGPLLERLGVAGAGVVFIGDTPHDRVCASVVGARFAIATWNPRATAEPGDLVLREPSDVLELVL